MNVPKIHSSIKCSLKDGSGQFTAKVHSNAEKATSQYKSHFNICRIDTGTDKSDGPEKSCGCVQQVEEQIEIELSPLDQHHG